MQQKPKEANYITIAAKGTLVLIGRAKNPQSLLKHFTKRR
jgi:hypothetical protein